jgi:hypothetical protein
MLPLFSISLNKIEKVIKLFKENPDREIPTTPVDEGSADLL